MEKEFIKNTEKNITLNVTAGRIDSFRRTEKTTGTVRVYENGCIGVAGCIGEPNEEELTKRATEALEFAIPYPEKLEGALELEQRHDEEIIPIHELIPTMQAFLDRLGKECPNFAFSNKIGLEYTSTEYVNSKGRRLFCSGGEVNTSLLVQNRGSGNVFDTFLGWKGDSFDADALITQFKKEYDAFFKRVDIEPGRYPIVIDISTVLYRFANHFIGELYAAGASLLSGKLGEKIFSDKLSVMSDMNAETTPGACFFDAEGCVSAPDFRPCIVENGVLKGLLTCKKSADTFNIPNIGTAQAAYDGVPGVGLSGLYVSPTAKSLKQLVQGKAIYVVMAEGGDATPDGHFASPAQLAYLMEDGELVGRLGDINFGGNFFELFGKDYIGAVRDEPLKGSSLCAFMMDVSKG
ncbi:MAG: hypothetical protein IKS90_06200 [Clostridia bacterium]|nr:hypothetical protein [Clostridia bacterium]